MLPGGVDHLGNVAQVDGSAVHAADRIIRHLLGRAGAKVAPDEDLLVSIGERACRTGLVLHVQHVPDVEEAHLVGGQPLPIHDDLHLELLPPEGHDRVDVPDRFEPVHHLVFGQCTKLNAVIPLSRHRQGQDRDVQGVDGEHPGRLQVRPGHGQVGLDDVHQRLDVEERLLHVCAVPELDRHDGEAFLRRGADEVDVLQVHHPLLDGLAEVDLHLLGREARHHGHHADDRALDIGHHAARHLVEDHQHRQHRHPEVEGDDRVGMLDGPAADVAAGHRHRSSRGCRFIAQGFVHCRSLWLESPSVNSYYTKRMIAMVIKWSGIGKLKLAV